MSAPPADNGRYGQLTHPRGGGSAAVDWTTKAMRYALLLILAALFLLPFYILIRNAFMTQEEIAAFDRWQWFPAEWQWGNIRSLFEEASINFTRAMIVSGVLATIALVFQTLFSSMAGFALARIPFRGANVIFYLILFTLMIPSAVTFIPTFLVVNELGGIPSLWGIVVPGLFSAFGTFLFRQFYLSFPTEIEEAARLDGSTYFGVYAKMLLPNSMGIMAALGVLSFIGSWNAFLWPLIAGGSSVSTRTVQVVLSGFLTAQTINLPGLFAGALIGAIPLVIVFLLLQRLIVQGVTMSGIKG